MDFKALGDYVVIEPIKAPEKFGNIFIPQTAQKETNRGIIVSLGDNLKEDLNINDEVFYHASDDIRKTKISQKELVIVREKDVLAVCVSN